MEVAVPDYKKAKQKIADRIRECRASSGRTLCVVSKAAGISKTYLCEIENGQRQNPSVETLLRLAHALEVSPCYLLTGRP